MAIAESILRNRVERIQKMLCEQALDVLMVYALGSALGPGTRSQHFSPAELTKVFRFRHGHGLGHSYEEPVSSVPFPQIYDTQAPQAVAMAAQPGMLFELHPNLFVPGVGGACIGDMAVVTTQGNRLLTQYPREMIQWLD